MEEKKKILRRAQTGETYSSIAHDFKVTPTAIAYHVRGELPSRAQRKLTSRQIDEAVERWRKGETVAELARRFGVGHSAMTKQITARTNEPIGRVRRASALHLPTDPSHLAYLAGIIDGEGCISRQTSSRAWTVAVSNTSPELESWLKGVGGLFYYPPRRASFKLDGSYTKQRFEWKVSRAWDVLELLVAVKPFLVIKGAKAEEAMADIRSRFGERPQVG